MGGLRPPLAAMANFTRELSRWVLCRIPRFTMHFYPYVILAVAALVALLLAFRD